MQTRAIFITALTLWFNFLTYARCPCPSELYGNLRRLTHSLAFGVELANSYYFVKSDALKHYFFPKINSAFTYSRSNNLSFLLNVMLKYRPPNTINCPLGIAKTGFIFGIWQGFADLEVRPWQMRIGRQHYKNGLGYIFDMRMDGILVTRTLGKQTGQIFLGTVATDIGQNGFFCQREILLEERLCFRQLCKARFGENSLLAISFNMPRVQLTFARQFARVNYFNEYLIKGLVTIPIIKNLSFISELAPRYGLAESKFYYTTISYLDYRTNLLRTKLGGLVSNKAVLLGMAGLGARMRYGPEDGKVVFLEMTVFPRQPILFQVNQYYRLDKQYKNQNYELDVGAIIRYFSRTQIFIFGTIIDLFLNRPVLQASLEVYYII